MNYVLQLILVFLHNRERKRKREGEIKTEECET